MKISLYKKNPTKVLETCRLLADRRNQSTRRAKWQAALTLVSFHLKMREAFSLLTLSAWIKLMWGDAAGALGVVWRRCGGQRVPRRADVKGIKCEEIVVWKHPNDLAAGLFRPGFFSVSLGSLFIHTYWYAVWNACPAPEALPHLDPIPARRWSVTRQKSVEFHTMICRITKLK